MTLQPIKDVSEYKRLKLTLRDRFESEKTGDQSLFEEQTKKYKPLLSYQQEISKTMRDVANQIVESQNEGQAALPPLLLLLQKYTESTTSATTIADSYHSIKLRHSPIIHRRTGCEISYFATSSTIFISQGSNRSGSR